MLSLGALGILTGHAEQPTFAIFCGNKRSLGRSRGPLDEPRPPLGGLLPQCYAMPPHRQCWRYSNPSTIKCFTTVRGYRKNTLNGNATTSIPKNSIKIQRSKGGGRITLFFTRYFQAGWNMVTDNAMSLVMGCRILLHEEDTTTNVCKFFSKILFSRQIEEK